MGSWKQAFTLAWFELRKSKIGLWYLIVVLVASSILFEDMLPSYLENNFVGMDVFFLIAMGVPPVWMKRKEFQYQKIDENTWGSPLFITLSQLPIKKEVLVGSRFIIYFTFAIPFQIFLLTSLYIFSSEIRASMPLGAYLVFSIIWLAYGVCLGGAFPAVDAGDKITLVKSTIQGIAFLVVLFIALTLFNLIYGDGLVTWTIMLANEWPILSILVSILVGVLATSYYVNYAYNKMKTIDYLK